MESTTNTSLRAINGTFSKVIKCEYCTSKTAAVAMLVGFVFKDLCIDCAFKYGADESDLD